MKYKIIFIDLDGTLLGADGEIPQANILAIEQARQAGIKIVMASGRLEHAQRRFYSQLGLDTPIISCNGALVRTNEGEVLRHVPIKNEIYQAIIDDSFTRKVHLNFYHTDELSACQSTEWSEWSNRQTPDQQMRYKTLDELRKEPATKLVAVADADTVQCMLDEYTKQFDGTMYITTSEANYLEMMDAQANKGLGLKTVCDYFGIEPVSAVAIGDSLNDIPMLQTAGMSYAVSNAKDLVLKSAKQRTSSNSDGGVARAIEITIFENN